MSEPAGINLAELRRRAERMKSSAQTSAATDLLALEVFSHPCTRCNGTGRVPDRRRTMTPETKSEIRRRLTQGERGKDLAAEYECTPSQISRIKHDYGRRR